MSRKKYAVIVAALLLCHCAATAARAGEAGLESTMEMDFAAVAAIDGIRVVAAKDVPGKSYTEDHGPSQVLEIIRANQAPISVGRLMTSCTCLKAVMEKREFAQGERALIEVRNVRPTQPDGATYAVFVRLSAPYKATLQYEIFVKSDRNLNPVPKAGGGTAALPPVPTGDPVPAPGFSFEDIVPYKSRAAGQ